MTDCLELNEHKEAELHLLTPLKPVRESDAICLGDNVLRERENIDSVEWKSCPMLERPKQEPKNWRTAEPITRLILKTGSNKYRLIFREK